MKSRILIIDDEKNILELFRETLGDEYGVLTAASGEDGMEIVRRSPGLDLAFIDKNLPGMDGIETFKGIKSTRS